MLTALARAFAQLGDPAIRRVLWLGLGGALLLLAATAAGLAFLLARIDFGAEGWLDQTIDILGGVAVALLALLLFPAASGVISGFLLDTVADAVERRHYPALPPAREVGLGESLRMALRFLVLLVLANLAALVLVWWIPIVNLIVYYSVNGYLLGREYFEMVAQRRTDSAAATGRRRRHRARVFAAGVIIAFLLTVPVLNLLVPVVATAFMVHVFHGLPGEGRAA